MMDAQERDRPEEVSAGPASSEALRGEKRDLQTEVERLTSALKGIVCAGAQITRG
jgi:hypothetical protein